MVKKKKVVNNESCCTPCESGHQKCIGICVLSLGILILLNALYGWLTWGVFIGVVVALKGVILLLHPNCCK